MFVNSCLLPLVGSGIALFFSQVLLYQSIGTMGAAIGSALFFLYPLTAVPSSLILHQERSLTPFGILALVAIAMGGLLIGQPTFSTRSTWFNLDRYTREYCAQRVYFAD